MARAKGGDVFLELMETAAALEKAMGEQTLRTSRVENSVRVLEERVSVVEENVEILSEGVRGLHESVRGLQESVRGLHDSVRGLGTGVRDLREVVSEMHKGAQVADETVHRLARLLIASQRRDDERFSSLDDRVTRLERKTG